MPKLSYFQPLFEYFSVHLYLFSSYDSNDMTVGSFVRAQQVPEALLFFFFSLFSPYCSDCATIVVLSSSLLILSSVLSSVVETID